ncbi:hypothetical protein N0B44_29315 [Roseibacterium beibuensis]|uniref:hypothetical protein n=1 Tax=[Roseibacterium] beibuensis TaxID=1193142 RepID=UPI00217E7D54|nr:hypothetical protein [Roseibacterium beibuensis]MCS6627021.1 hypothetical protein [Roseibacterium beibuensis]
MRLTLTLAAALAAGTLALPAAAQTTAPAEGQYEAALRRMIVETAAGSCPADVMAGPLLAACQQQLPQMSAGLASLGAVESVTFVRAEDRDDGRLEIYEVRFAGGQTLNWGIGGMKDGKFDVAFAGG